jgi:hypothetical protein
VDETEDERIERKEKEAKELPGKVAGMWMNFLMEAADWKPLNIESASKLQIQIAFAWMELLIRKNLKEIENLKKK